MQTTERRAFDALRVPGFARYLVTFMLTMMADNIEHVISYWVAFQKFHSSALGGFAVVSHWLPYLLFSVPVGALNDRFDSRRLIQIGVALFMTVSLGWGYFFVTDTLQMWHAMVLLVLHGCAGVLWRTSSQMLLYDIVGPDAAAERRAPERDRALPRHAGRARRRQRDHAHARADARHLPERRVLPAAPALAGARAVRSRTSAARAAGPSARCAASPTSSRPCATCAASRASWRMMVLAGGASFFVGNSYQAQMPGFAHDLGHGDPGVAYTVAARRRRRGRAARRRPAREPRRLSARRRPARR